MKSVSIKVWMIVAALAQGSVFAVTPPEGGFAAPQAIDPMENRPMASPMTTTALPATIERASSIIGMPVRDKSGASLGRVEEIVLKPDHRSIDYLSFLPAGSGFTDRKYVRAPTDKVMLSADRTFLTYDSDKEQVSKDAAVVDSTLPWSQKVTALLGTRVFDSDNQSAGTIRNLLIDVSNHSISKATVGTGGLLGLGEKLASVDWSGVSLHDADRSASIGLTADELRGIAYKADTYWEQLGFAGDEKAKPNEPATEEKMAPADTNKPVESPKADTPKAPDSSMHY